MADSDVKLRALPAAAVAATLVVTLYALSGTPTNILLRQLPSTTVSTDITVTLYPFGGVVFPTQYAGLRAYYNGAVRELCLVAAADANTGMGAAPMLRKGGVTYAVYLVETTDPDATPVRIRTSTGTKAIRIKT